jgi:hypothetical protein
MLFKIFLWDEKENKRNCNMADHRQNVPRHAAIYIQSSVILLARWRGADRGAMVDSHARGLIIHSYSAQQDSCHSPTTSMASLRV